LKKLGSFSTPSEQIMNTQGRFNRNRGRTWKQNSGRKRGCPLHDACQKGEDRRVRILLAEGAAVNKRNAHGQAAIHLASAAGNHGALILLLEGGANISALDMHGRTPLHYVAGGGPSLRSRTHGRSEGRIAHDRLLCLNILLKRTSRLDVVDALGNTPMHYFSDPPVPKAIRILCAKGAARDTPNRRLETPLDLAIISNDLPAVKALFETVSYSTMKALRKQFIEDICNLIVKYLPPKIIASRASLPEDTSQEIIDYIKAKVEVQKALED